MRTYAGISDFDEDLETWPRSKGEAVFLAFPLFAPPHSSLPLLLTPPPLFSSSCPVSLLPQPTLSSMSVRRAKKWWWNG